MPQISIKMILISWGELEIQWKLTAHFALLPCTLCCCCFFHPTKPSLNNNSVYKLLPTSLRFSHCILGNLRNFWAGQTQPPNVREFFYKSRTRPAFCLKSHPCRSTVGRNRKDADCSWRDQVHLPFRPLVHEWQTADQSIWPEQTLVFVSSQCQ